MKFKLSDTPEKFEDLSFFDNLALHYLCRETPPPTLALVFLHADPKIAGAMLGVIEPKRRAYIHKLMGEVSNTEAGVAEKAKTGLLLIAENLIQKNLIHREGRFFYGKKMN